MADTLGQMARHVLALADERGADTLELFGHSMGGRVAAEVLRIAPDRVTRLALASSGLNPAVPGEAEKREAMQRIGYEQGYEALVDRWMGVLLSKDEADAPYADDLRAMCIAQGQAVFDAHNKALLARPPFADVLSDFTGPVLSITGEHDRMAPPAEHEAIADHAPISEFLVIESAGHLITLQRAEEVNTAIARWLA
ncbi:alpha/beta fold hydrolase [Aurantiacibacter sp. MUD61]|uniref:alpha/beta fold hydrolase n=1 Tax=Aurantiacibacter sp. MUD61 TaxID=3009083 RepID=UPI0022F01206|nr:alpha/beta fold hydrolase [Aurantiacibacter sp. MUD61]